MYNGIIMGLKEFLQDEGSVRLGCFLGRHLSSGAGRYWATQVGCLLARKQDRQMIRNIKANQWVITGESLGADELQAISKLVVVNMTKALFEYFYYYEHPEEGRKLINLSPEMETAIDEMIQGEIPTLILGPHLGNFDLFGMMLTWLGLRPLVLSVPNPNNAYKAQNKLRENLGIRVLPLTPNAYREARQTLKAGGTVVTGLDRAAPEQQKYLPRFFGYPAPMPVFYVNMVLDLNVKVRVACGLPRKDGSYYLDSSQPLAFKRLGDSSETYLYNSELALKEAEKFIRRYPAQWAMFHPVWPHAARAIESIL